MSWHESSGPNVAEFAKACDVAVQGEIFDKRRPRE